MLLEMIKEGFQREAAQKHPSRKSNLSVEGKAREYAQD